MKNILPLTLIGLLYTGCKEEQPRPKVVPTIVKDAGMSASDEQTKSYSRNRVSLIQACNEQRDGEINVVARDFRATYNCKNSKPEDEQEIQDGRDRIILEYIEDNLNTAKIGDNITIFFQQPAKEIQFKVYDDLKRNLKYEDGKLTEIVLKEDKKSPQRYAKFDKGEFSIICYYDQKNKRRCSDFIPGVPLDIRRELDQEKTSAIYLEREMIEYIKGLLY